MAGRSGPSVGKPPPVPARRGARSPGSCRSRKRAASGMRVGQAGEGVGALKQLRHSKAWPAQRQRKMRISEPLPLSCSRVPPASSGGCLAASARSHTGGMADVEGRPWGVQ